MSSNQINPNHYKASGIETWEMMLKIWGTEAFIKHCEMCAFKYRMRAGLKQGASVETDLAKANWYEAKAKMLGSTESREPYTNPHSDVKDEKGILPDLRSFGGNLTSGKLTLQDSEGNERLTLDKDGFTVDGKKFNVCEPKELIPVDSLMEVPFKVDENGDIFLQSRYLTMYKYCREYNIDQTKIKRIFLEMDK